MADITTDGSMMAQAIHEVTPALVVKAQGQVLRVGSAEKLSSILDSRTDLGWLSNGRDVQWF